MAEDKPWALISEKVRDVYLKDFLKIMEEHFHLICHKDLLENPQLYGPKVQAVFVWCHPRVEPSLLRLMPSLKVVASGGVGIDHLDVPYISSLGVKVTNTPDVVNDATADIAMGLLLASAREIVEGYKAATDPEITHEHFLMGVEVTGSTVGIVGMGRIGYKVAQRSKGFDMKILYHNRSRRSVEDEQAVGATYCEKIDDLLKESDFVVLVVNLSAETKGLISHRELSLMKPTATLVNVSRGLVVDQDALVKALQSGTIRAAALDVTYPEPLPRKLLPLVQGSSLVKGTYVHSSARQLQNRKVMAEEKPWALFSEVGENGYLEDVMGIMEKHFQLICHKDFLQNPKLYGPKVQSVFVWNALPAAEPSLLRLMPSLKVIANGGVGIDHLDVPYISSLGVKVTNTPDVVNDATADIAMGLLLASARKIVEGHQVCVDPKTTHLPLCMMGVEVTGSTVGIVGMGRIGYKVAQRSKGFDMKILYHNRSRRSVEDEQAVGATYCEKIDDLLKESDFVVLVVNLSAETKGLISHRELSLMKPTATLVNVSRGLVVDQDALVKALQSGTIRAAALDVTYPEPLPRDHPLLHLPNVLITPHVGTNTYTTTRKIVQRMVDNAVAAVKGQPAHDEVK